MVPLYNIMMSFLFTITWEKKYDSIWKKISLVHLRLRVIGKGNGSEICHITGTANGKKVFQFTTQYEKAKGNLPISIFLCEFQETSKKLGKMFM